MKNINVMFEDSEYRDLKRVKKKLSWHDFIMKLAESEGG